MADLITSQLATRVVQRATTDSKMIATAESCTGGLISAAITDISGSSAIFTHGFVTYANDAKQALLGVPHAMLMTHGAVSSPVALAMAHGARMMSGADLTVAVTGIAGPGGGTPDKPVGLVYIATSTPKKDLVHRHVFTGGSRRAIRAQTVKAALRYLASSLTP